MGGKAKLIEIWGTFPEIHFGFRPDLRARPHRGVDARQGPRGAAQNPVADEASVFPRYLLRADVFLDRGLSNFRRLWADGLGKLAAVYFVSLFGFVIWVGLFISWIFFHGVKPPLAG